MRKLQAFVALALAALVIGCAHAHKHPVAVVHLAPPPGAQTAGSTVTLLNAINGLASDTDWNGHKLTNVGDPSSAQDVATKTSSEAVVTAARVVTALGSAAADVSVNSHKITSLATPTAGTDAATKTYADGVVTFSAVNTALAAANAAIDVNAQNVKNIAQLGVGTASPTHDVTLATSKSLALYNTADQTTNYERVRLAFNSNVAQLLTENGGSGTLRAVSLKTSAGNSITVNANGHAIAGAFSTTAGPMVAISNGGSFSSTSAVQQFVQMTGTVNQTSGSGGFDALDINPTLTAVGSAGANLLRLRAGSTDFFRVDRTGKPFISATITAGGTTGNQTINKPCGTVNFAASATSVTVTNSTVTTSSVPICTIRTNDATAQLLNCVPSSGSLLITMKTAPTAETSVGFCVIDGQ